MLAASAAILVPAAFTGCATTMQKNARTLLLNQRALASERPIDVTRANPSVEVLGISAVRGRGGAAVAVRLRDDSHRPLTDLPISVGIRTRTGRLVYFNRSANLGYYGAHVAALDPGRITTWVYAASRLPRARGRLFATVGLAQLPSTTTATRLPALAVAVRGETGAGGLLITVWNRSGIPQYGVQVYAVAHRGPQTSAVARGTVAALDAGARASLALHLVGSAARARLSLYALPTIYL